MSKYRVLIHGTVSAVVEVEANSHQEAIDYALENAPQTSLAGADFDGVDDWNLSGYYEDGEWFENGESQ
jgi:hypothetical protein